MYKMLLITITKTIVTEQHYRFRYVLSSLCFGIALGEVLTVSGRLDCAVDDGTSTVLCIPHSFYYSYMPCRSFMLAESSLSLSVIIGSSMQWICIFSGRA